MTFVIASRALFELSVFARTLLKEGHTVIFSTNPDEIKDMLSADKIDALIGNEKDLEMIKGLICQFPMLNTAVISDKPAKEFHETTEGLGVLMQIPSLPEKDHSIDFVNKLQHIQGLTI